MKKVLFTLLIMLISISGIKAQHNKREKLKAYKTAYITQELDLSSSEAEKFWPVYNVYEKKSFELKVIKTKEARKKIMDKGGIDALTESEANAILLKLTDNEELILKARKELYKNLKNIISAKKILKLNKAEHEFNRKLLSDFRKKHMGSNR